jgi:hypothetical protein
MVNKNGGGSISLFGKSTFELCYESWCRRFQLVDGDAVTRRGCYSDLVLVLNSFCPPGSLGHCSVHTSSTFWGLYCE